MIKYSVKRIYQVGFFMLERFYYSFLLVVRSVRLDFLISNILVDNWSSFILSYVSLFLCLEPSYGLEAL